MLAGYNYMADNDRHLTAGDFHRLDADGAIDAYIAAFNAHHGN